MQIFVAVFCAYFLHQRQGRTWTVWSCTSTLIYFDCLVSY